MKPRSPTTQELKLWRQSNRFTRKKKPDPELEDTPDEEDFAALISPSTQKAAPAAPTTKAKRTPTAMAPLPTRDAKKRLKGYPEIDATLDLHGLTKLEAYERVQGFVTRQYKAGKRHLLIITGKGRLGEGILRSELPHWLNEPALRPMISAFTAGRPEKGGTGVTHVLVKKYRDR